MSLIIRSTGISAPNNNIGYLEHATLAAKNCIQQAGIELDEIDLLINVGVFRDNNMCEPSVAALIQHSLGINLNPITFPVKQTTFSFDLMNGACGMMNALQVSQAILVSKGLKSALLVSGDSHPSQKSTEDFPIVHSGSALLVEKEVYKGFSKFMITTSPQFSGQSGFLDLDLHGTDSRFSLQLEQNGTIESMTNFTIDTIQQYLDTEHINTQDVQMIISHPSSQFGKEISSAVGIKLASCNEALSSWGDTHTANVAIGAHLELSKGTLKTDLLFVTVGTGYTVGCGLYRK